MSSHVFWMLLTGKLPASWDKRQNLELFWIWSQTGLSLFHFGCGCSGSSRNECRCTTSCLLCYLSIAYPNYAIGFQFLIALDFSSHYMHMYRQVIWECWGWSGSINTLFSSLVTGSRSHKLVTSDVSHILWLYYNDSVRL